MSSLISTTLVENALISEISPSLNYAVVSGPSKSTYTTSNASTFSNSVVQFTVKTPNQSVLIDRAVKMSARLTLKFNIGGPVGSKYSVPFDEDEPAEDQVTVFEYSNTESFQAYPLNSLITNSNIEINNAGVSCSNMDLKDILSTLTDHRALNKKNSSTPSYYDSIYGEYEDCVGATNSPLAGSFSNSLDDSYQGRGGHPVTMIVRHYDAAGDEYPLVAPYGEENGFYSCLKPAAEGDTWIIYLTGDFTENFLYLSPLLSTLSHDQQGMMGVNDITINLNIDSECKRVFSTAKTFSDPAVENSLRPLYISKIAIEKDGGAVGWENLKMSFNFLTLQSSQLARIKEPTQVLPYMRFDKHITSANGLTVIAPQKSGEVISNSLSLTSVPDRIFVAARIPLSAQNSACPSSFLALEKINVSFDNGDGALANCSPVDLFSLSQKNGSAQTFSSFRGVMSVHASEVPDQLFKQIPSFGSVLCIDPANDLNLPEFITNGSIGAYNLSITVTIKNYHSYPIKPELVIITSNSGVFGLSLFDGEIRPLSVCYLPAWGAEEVGVVEPSWPSDGGGRRGARRDVESPKRCAPSNGGSSPSAASVDCRAACPCGTDRRACRASPTPRVHQRILLGKKGCHPFASKSFCTSVRSQLPGDDARLSHHKERHILRGPSSRWVGDRRDSGG